MSLGRSWQIFLVLALFANYLSASVMSLIWKNQIVYYFMALAISLLAGIILKDFSRAIVTIGSSFIVSTVISVLAAISPLLIYGAPGEQVSVGIMWYSKTTIISLIMTLPLCIIVGVVGCFIADFISR